MNDVVIDVRNISKKYEITTGYQPDTLRERIVEIAKYPLNLAKGTHKTKKKTFWALKNISFQVKRGEVLGIIGKNGAGKSTLLKILSRITEPTDGSITMHGRVASLLEVGTGFNPELTGRENIYLNGAIIGMTRAEIDRKIEDIIEFSGVREFIDTPVKRYSSGMYVRLAFAVAAHVSPDILILDEVLSVGDIEFQKKCHAKIKELVKGDTTIILVSHNILAVRDMSTKILYLNKGLIHSLGENIEKITHLYLTQDLNTKLIGNNLSINNHFGNKLIKINKFYIESKLVKNSFSYKDDLRVHIEGTLKFAIKDFTLGIAVFDEAGTELFWSYQSDIFDRDQILKNPGKFHITCELPINILNLGTYSVKIIGGIHFQKWFFAPNDDTPIVSFTISGKPSESPLWTIKRPGIIAPRIQWKVI